jgi:hypothetical protein
MNNMAVVIDYGATASTTPRKLFPGLPQLRHGILRQQHPSNDQPYVIVPAGYVTGRPSQSLEQGICSALRLERWPLLLLVVVANNDTHAANTAAESTMPESSSSDSTSSCTMRVDEMVQRLATYMAQLGSIWIMVRKEHHHHHQQHYDDTVQSSQSMAGVGLTLLPNCNRPSENQRDDRVTTNATKPAVSSTASNTSTATATRWALFEHETDARLFEHGLMIHTRVTTPTLLLVYGHVTEFAMARIRALLRDDEDTTHIVLFPGTSPVVDDLCRALHAHPASENEDNDRPGYDLERILMIGNDISTDQFLALVHGTLDEAFSPWDAQIDALNQANGLLQTLGKHCFWQQCRTIVLHVQIIAGTLLAVAASVWYAHAYVIGPPTLLTNTTQCTCFAATILVPVLVTILERYAQSTAATNPMVAWCALRKAIGALVSEIFLFQSRAGCYSRTATNNSRIQATETFVRQIYSIMSSVSTFLPSSENANLLPVTPDKETAPLTMPLVTQRHVAWTRPTSHKTAASGSNDRMQQAADKDMAKGRTVWNKRNKTMTVSRYIRQRLEPILHEKRRVQSIWMWREAVLNRLVQAATISTSLLAATSRQWLIPLVLALAAALATAKSLLNYSSSQQRAAATVAVLEELLEEWRRSCSSPSNDTLPLVDAVEDADKLIVQSEQVILREIRST